MRGAIGRRINNHNHFLTSTAPFSLQPTSSFCSGSGRGRGRGSGVPSTPFQFTAPGQPDQPDSDSKPEPEPKPTGRGRPPAPSSPFLHSYNSFLSSVKASGAGRGRSVSESNQPTRPTESTSPSEPPPNLPSSVRPVSHGAGRGKPGDKQPPPLPAASSPIKVENRHMRPRPRPVTESGSVGPKMSKEEAVEHARRVLSQGGEGEEISGGGPGRGRSRGRGRGRVGGKGRGRGGDFHRREREDDDDNGDDDDEGFASGWYLGDNADGEKLAEKLGVENMNLLVEGFEEMSSHVLPSHMEDAYIDALHTNYMIECEPEYLMGDFESNPDIDEQPPIPLRDALEKMKPFLMAYEGIQSHEEWEEAINEVMERVPLMKEIVDYYSGPDRVTAKQQQEELERVAETIPKSAPASMKRFANRAVLSLQSNPGWVFNKKCQFMDKLVLEVSKLHK